MTIINYTLYIYIYTIYIYEICSFYLNYVYELCVRVRQNVPQHKWSPPALASEPVGALPVTAAAPLLKDCCGAVLQGIDVKPCCGALLCRRATYR